MQDIDPGKYVVAVSGGVDSMVLLHMLAALRPDLELVVAHFDHGIRQESGADRTIVESEATKLSLPFIYKEGKLGPGASEEVARTTRYEFLHEVRIGQGAKAVLTAHHADDVLETAIINIIRGTGRRGLSSLRSTDTVIRPLLSMGKDEILDYARRHSLQWREDVTNLDLAYLRNHVRQVLLPRFAAGQKQELALIVQRAAWLNDQIDAMLENLLISMQTEGRLRRAAYINLPHVLALEVMAAWLRSREIRDFDTKTLERLVHAAKIKAAGKQADVYGGVYMVIGRHDLALTSGER